MLSSRMQEDTEGRSAIGMPPTKGQETPADKKKSQDVLQLVLQGLCSLGLIFQIYYKYINDICIPYSL